MASPGFHVQLVPLGTGFVAGDGLTLLAGAEQAGVLMPSSCRNGTCRTCIARLESGSVRYAIEWPGLSREEKAEGWILPCVAFAASDVVVVAPEAR